MFRIILLLIFGFTLAASRHDPFYRLDYTYIEQFDSFYKLHWDHSKVSWTSAYLACEDEESTLFYPRTKNEWTVVKKLLSSMTVKPNVTDILIGIHDEFGFGELKTVDGLPTPAPIDNFQPSFGTPVCVRMDVNSGSFMTEVCNTTNLAYVCKKHEVIETCPTIDKGYVYVKETRKCYKAHKKLKTWNKAMQTCFMEGGSLMVIENSNEAEILRGKLITDYGDYFAGFRKLSDKEFHTIKGQKFDDKFYTNWYENKYECGIISRYDGILYTLTSDCLNVRKFFCEMIPKIYTWSFLGNQLTAVESNYRVLLARGTEHGHNHRLAVEHDC